MNNKKITLIGINIYPEDTAIGLYSTQMSEFLQKQGHKVTVVAGFPYYPQWKIKKEYSKKPTFYKEEVKGVTILRYKQYVPKKPNFINRVLHLMDFTIGSYFNLRKIKQTDVIIVIVPFTSTILLGWLLKRRTKAKLWVHIQDFEFDAALQSGISENKGNVIKGMVFKFLFWIEKYLLSKADVASTISNIMVEKLKTKTEVRIEYFPNWVDSKKIDPESYDVHPYMKTLKFKILYSGNIGDKQDWEFFIELVEKLNGENMEIIVVGDGAKREWLCHKITEHSIVKYFPPVPFEQLSNLLCSADLHILFQKKNVIDTVMPSKLLGMMASGRPSIVIGNMKSEVRTVLLESKGGIYESNYNLNKILDEIEKLANNKNIAQEMGLNARNYVMDNFEKDKILSSLNNKIDVL